MKITFLGAANTVTGSNYLITTDKYKFLIDCGQFQGSKEIEKLNFKEFNFSPSEIDFLILTHAHLDHSGRIPKLIKEGFHNKIYCTRPTVDLCDILLKDSGHIHEMETELENKKRKKAGLEEISPLYTVEDAEISMQYFNPIPYDEIININRDIKLRLKDAGHLLGSAIIELWITENNTEKKLVFSGDLGTKDRPLLKNPNYITETDYLIIESTYGNRVHENASERISKLVNIILNTIKENGNVIIPSFAVGRTQEIIYELNKYNESQENSNIFSNIPIYIDSPLAISATEIFKKHINYLDEEIKNYILRGKNPLVFKNLKFTRSIIESKKINIDSNPKIIISTSGMCEAGRIKYHLKNNLWKENSSIIFVGYQAEGTLGREIQNGAKTVKIFDENINVNAKIYSIESFSGHADMNDLIKWIGHFNKMPKKTFIVHGEKDSTANLSNLIKENFKLDTIIPNLNESFKI
ncbi:MBL fold metallo-hydrolase RNA specificity domain-containing protein [Caminicella sporogenes]|uniref:MBL fold metallo-hydrolase RNA specificity domain-containing protein n=1 Tax=Caminicella sporogenes TaxID=166485 RepID=UPI0025401BFF|nr:MBL fold metallo-hydrolase [Caminicella sporogenes]WIF95728.1 MBL fold metallo-hydrolase [Caminicella sporogenes]